MSTLLPCHPGREKEVIGSDWVYMHSHVWVWVGVWIGGWLIAFWSLWPNCEVMPVITLQNLDPRFEWITETFFWWWYSYFPCLIIILKRLWGVEEQILEGGETPQYACHHPEDPSVHPSSRLPATHNAFPPMFMARTWKVSYLGVLLVSWCQNQGFQCLQVKPLSAIVSVRIGAEAFPQHKGSSKYCFRFMRAQSVCTQGSCDTGALSEFIF